DVVSCVPGSVGGVPGSLPERRAAARAVRQCADAAVGRADRSVLRPGRCRVLTVAVVGGAGQVGRELLRALRSTPETRAFGITRNAMAAAPLLADGFDIRVGSVADSAAVLLQGADVVVNAALEIDRPKRARMRNEALVGSIVRHARAALVVHFSTVAVYG